VTDVSVRISGLRELNTAFRQIDRELPKNLRAGFLPVAQHVVGVAQQRMPHLTGTAQRAVKPRATQRGASIAFGGDAAPYGPWLDFGGRVGRRKSIVRPFITEGRYVYPGIAESREEIEQGADTAVKNAARHAGFETKGAL
jgi:hypothetical protein